MGGTPRLYEMEHPSIQVWHSVLWEKDALKQNLSLRHVSSYSNFLLLSSN